MQTLEILATIIIVFGVIKLIFILISPEAWLNFAKKVYVKPKVTSIIALILAIIVLYYLIDAGITIVHILAITLFMGLVMVTGISIYFKGVIDWVMRRDVKNILKEQWLLTLIWILLLAWGIKEIFF